MTLRTGLKAALAVVATVVLLCLVIFGWLKLAPRTAPRGQPPLATLSADSLPSFRVAFNANQGQVRIVAMLSPT